jgi:hypothetical protein
MLIFLFDAKRTFMNELAKDFNRTQHGPASAFLKVVLKGFLLFPVL